MRVNAQELREKSDKFIHDAAKNNVDPSTFTVFYMLMRAAEQGQRAITVHGDIGFFERQELLQCGFRLYDFVEGEYTVNIIAW